MVVVLGPDEELAAPHFPGPRQGPEHDVDRLPGRGRVDEPAHAGLADEGDGEGPVRCARSRVPDRFRDESAGRHAQRSPRLNVIASKGRTLTGSSSFAHAMSTHSPSRSSNASNVRSVGSTSHRYATPSRA